MGFLDRAKIMGSMALEKGKDLAQITKLNIDISTIETKISELYKNIGEEIVSKNLHIDNEKIVSLQSKIAELINEIETKKEEIDNIQKS